ncbi:Acetyltransferase pyr8 [Talaromyces pinophilus]|nr:Acetyltransferase pyr8 [Talaromyces pinophilus]
MALTAFNPLFVISSQVLLSSVVTGFTSASSPWRLISPLFSLGCAAITTQHARDFVRPFWAALLAGLSFVYFLHFVDLALLSRWDFNHGGPVFDNKPTQLANKREKKDHAKRSSLKPTLLERFSWGFSQSIAWRHVNTPYQSKNCPPYSYTNPTYIPSRPWFVVRSLFLGAICYLVIDVLNSQPPPENPSELFSPSRVHFFTRLLSPTAEPITVDELGLRAMVTFVGYTSSYCLLNAVAHFQGAFFVAIGVNGVRDWRPLFGSVREIYSLRQFWGKFWHQNLRRMISEPVEFVAHKVLRLSSKGILQRYIKIVLSFYLSGVTHAIADIASNLSWAEQLTVEFFVLQAVGIIIEDTVQAGWRFLNGQTRTGRQNPPRLWIRFVGGLWVALFLIWSTPRWVYPGASKAGPETRSIVPYSFVLRNWT